MQMAQRRVIQRQAPRGFAAEAAAAGPRGLPRATSRGRLSPAGIDTGPSSASHRMVTEAAFVANPDEVRAAGPMLGRRDLARAVARRSTVGPPSPSTGGGRARRSAQASEPGPHLGPTRPAAPPAPDAPNTIESLSANTSIAPEASTAPIAAASFVGATGDAPGDTVATEGFAPRAMSLPPSAFAAANMEPSMQWQPLPRPGALARRGALAAELRRVARDLPRTRVGLGPALAPITTAATATSAASAASPLLNTRSLTVAPTIEAAAAAADAAVVARRASSPPPFAPVLAPAPNGAALRNGASSSASPPRPSTTGVHQTDGSVGSVHTSRNDEVRRVARWSAAATTLGDIPVSLLGPAAPASLLRARSLGAARVSTAAHAVRRALAPMSSWFSRSADLAAPMVSTIDRSPLAPRVAPAAAHAHHPSASLPALRSVADAVARVSYTPDQPAATMPNNAVVNRSLRAVAPAAGSVAPVSASRLSAAGLLGQQNRAVTTAVLAPMPSRLAEAPVPPLPMAAAFVQRATSDGSRETFPLLARARAAAAISSSAPAGRVPSVLAAFNAPLVRRSRFGAAIAPALTVAPSALPLQSAHIRMPSAAAATIGSVAAPLAVDQTHTRGDIRRTLSAPDVASPLAPTALTPPLPGVVPASAGARFLEALRERPADPLRPVPARFAPLARAIAGPRPVAVRSGPATSNALRRAGKRAATVDNVVHLASSPESVPPSVEVFAHELVHAARPSPIPRFFDDDHHSPEEELARATGNLMRAIQPPTIAGQAAADLLRRQPGADSRTPTFGTAGLAVGASGGLMSALAGASPSSPSAPKQDSPIRRSPASRPAAERRKARTSTSSPSRSSTGSAGALSTGSSSSGSMSPSTTIFRSAAGTGVVRRETAPTVTGAPGSSIFSSGGPAGGNNNDGGPGGLTGLVASVGAIGQSANTLSNSSSPADNELIERIIDAIEERVIAELERRGRRHHPGVF
ncbi:MAG: hypothetical protein QOD92_90 [Acidimicrobiaceae bacterium]